MSFILLNCDLFIWRFIGTRYRLQTKFAKVMFLQVSVCPHGGGLGCLLPGGGACVVALGGGMHGI